MTEKISAFKITLYNEEKCEATVDKYMRDIRHFCQALQAHSLTKEFTIQYKAALCGKCKPAGVNSRLVAVNRFLQFIGRRDCCDKTAQNSATNVCKRRAGTERSRIQAPGAGGGRQTHRLYFADDLRDGHPR